MLKLNEILVIVVLYNQNGIEGLNYVFPKEVKDIIVYDNSPLKSKILNSKRIEYIHDSRNLGISVAYNYAFKQATNREKKFLLLLDQDSKLTSEYFKELKSLEIEENVSCILPTVIDEKKDIIISPLELNLFGFNSRKTIRKGQISNRISAINSGALWSVDFINELNGFNDNYPLDYLDHWLFRESFRLRKKIVILNYVMPHNLSILHLDSTYPIERYESILLAEKKFYKEDKLLFKVGYKLRFVVRIIRLVSNHHYKHLYNALKNI
jgi:GT2 family glycosyltransferase